MRVWRLAPSLYPAFDGEGARRVGGRWNSPGLPAVYSSEHLSLAVLELLVHVDVASLPDNLVAYAVDLPDAAVERLDPAKLGADWTTHPVPGATREIGDRWLRQGGSLALVVPSAVIPEESNVLINPRHPGAEAALVAASSRPFAFDPRISR
jgi:RES domain-containing protein